MMGGVKDDYSFERGVLRAAAVATFLLGLALLFFTSHIIQLFDKSWGDEKHFAIYLGTALIGFAVTNWLYSHSHNLEAIQPAIVGNLVSLVTASVIDVVAIFTLSANRIIWLILILHLVFAAAFGYCLVAIRRD